MQKKEKELFELIKDAKFLIPMQPAGENGEAMGFAKAENNGDSLILDI